VFFQRDWAIKGEIIVLGSRFVRDISFTGRALACVAASLGFVTSANAADLDGLIIKAPPEVPVLTWNGITFIGVIDVAGQYEAKGAPYSGAAASTYSIVAPGGRNSQFILAPNQATVSYIGFKVDERLTSNVDFIARAEMGFNPTTGDLIDAPLASQRMNGIPLASQNVIGDSARAGQILNGEAYVGFKADTWGAIQVGRTGIVSRDMLGAYDPLASYGFSLIGYTGTFVGQGSAETGILDQSIKYLNSFGPFRVEVMYADPGTAAKGFTQGSFGYVQPNFSVDLLAGHASDIVSVSALAGPANLGSQFIGALVSDTDMYGAFAKYVFNVGGSGPFSTLESKFTVSGGYSRLVFSNPADGGLAPGHITAGNYELGPVLSPNGSIGSGIVNYAYTGGDRLMDISFITGKYQYDPQFSFVLGYYRYDSHSYGFGVSSLPGIVAPIYSKTNCSSSSFINCSGTEQVLSFRTDFQWTKNLMLYAGIAYSKVSGGMAFGFLNRYDYDPTVGVRFTF
jgi:predicted porin